MLEGDDDDLRRKLDKAKKDPTASPNLKYALEKQVKAGEKQKLSALQREFAKKQNMEQQKKLKEEMSKKGVLTIDEKGSAKTMIDNEKRKADADKAQGQTEKPTTTV